MGIVLLVKNNDRYVLLANDVGYSTRSWEEMIIMVQAARVCQQNPDSAQASQLKEIMEKLQENIKQVMAPYGLDDLFNKIVRPTPYYQKGSAGYPIYRKRIQDKQWGLIWKDFTIEE